MQALDMKKKVIKEIMELMDQKEGDRLKKHPKLMAASVQIEKPEGEEEDEASDDDLAIDEPKLDFGAEKSEDGEPELDQATIQKLLAMIKDDEEEAV